MRQLSTECAPCFRAMTRTRSSTLPASLLKLAPSVRRMPACVLFVGAATLRRAVASAPYSPAADDARQNTHRVPGPTQPRLATPNPAVSFPAAGCYESDPVVVLAARLA